MDENYQPPMKSLKLKKILKQEKLMHNQENLDPFLWKNLPHVLCDLVFARFPPNEIFRFQYLSKKWKHNITTSSTFTKSCDEAHPIILSLVTQCPNGDTWVRMLDIKHNKWYTNKLALYDILVQNRGGIGLICFLSRDIDRQQSIFLVNPLTRYCCQLPPIPHNTCKIITVEKLDNCIVASVDINTMVRGQEYIKIFTYDCLDGNGEWTISNRQDPYLLSKIDHHNVVNKSYYRCLGLVSYLNLKSKVPSQKICSAYHKETLYVMWERCDDSLNISTTTTTKYYIEEYHKANESLYTEVVGSKVHDCNPLESFHLNTISTTIHQCMCVKVI